MNDTTDRRPLIIQGGMGAGISDWRLARAVSSQGQLGVVSGTALDAILARRLQDGDPGGHMRRALDRFPSRPIADRDLEHVLRAGREGAAQPFTPLPLHDVVDPPELVERCIVANFVEVWLAQRGPRGPGRHQLSREDPDSRTWPSLYGAMLAGVDYVLMGAGIPLASRASSIALAGTKRRAIRSTLAGHADDATAVVSFDPRAHRAGAAAAADAAGLPRHRLVARARGGTPQARQRADRRLRRRRARPRAGTTRRRAARCS